MTDPVPVRESGLYAVYQGRTYRAGLDAAVPANVYLRWRGEGSPPDGFTLNPTRDKGGRKVTEVELDRLYKLTTLCGYRGGGPFRVNAVEPSEDGGSPLLYTTYVGDDREWALAQPGCEPNQMPMGAMEAREVWGHFRLDEVDFLRENIEDFRVNGRRRRRAATP